MTLKDSIVALIWRNLVNRCRDWRNWYRSEDLHVNLRKINREHR